MCHVAYPPDTLRRYVVCMQGWKKTHALHAWHMEYAPATHICRIMRDM
jgi:hypothetical protein